jgi:hypothetical protein
MQFLAGLQIELVDHPDDRLRRCRTQRLGNRPQCFFAVRRLDESQACRIETESVEAVSGKTAMLAPSIGRQDKDERGRKRKAGKERHDEAEGGRQFAFRLGYDLVQRAAGQAAFRQVAIDRGNAEGQDFVQTALA